jgi:hypothetical protein
VASRHLQDCSPHLCQLRTVRLALTSKYWMYRSYVGDMDPVSLVVSCQQELTFSHCSLTVVGEKLGTDPRIRWPSCCGLCREPFFSGIVDLFKYVDDCIKGCYMWTTWDTYGRGPYTEWAWKVCGMLVGFSPTGCTSIRITATLGYEWPLVCGSLLVVSLVTCLMVNLVLWCFASINCLQPLLD